MRRVGRTQFIVFILGSCLVLSSESHALDRNMSTVTVSNTTTDTSIYSTTVPGNLLATNRGLRVTLWGTYTNNTGANANLTVNVKLGGTTLMTKTMNNVTTSATAGTFFMQVMLFNSGATNTQRGAYHFYAERAGVLMAQLVMSTAAGAIDTTAARLLDVSVQHSVANANLTLVKQGAFCAFE